jgi:hypothetical protein
MDNLMLSQEEILCPFGPGLNSWALPLDSGGKSCRRRLLASFATTKGTINRKQMPLPSNDLLTPEAVQGPVPRVFLMSRNAFSGSCVRLGVESPMLLRNASRLCLLKGQMGFDPNNAGNTMAPFIDNGPQILMSTLGAMSLEEKLNAIMDIAAVRDERKRPCEKGQCDKNSIDFSSLGSLPGSWEGS